MKGSGQKVLERHRGQGHRVAQGLSPGWQHSFTPGSAWKGRHFAVCQNSFHPLPTATAPLDHCVHKGASIPSVQPTTLMFLGICWAGSTAAHFSKKIFLEGIRRKTSLGISSFSQPVTGSDAHLDLGRALVGWVLEAVGVGEALGAPARSVTGDWSGHGSQGRTHSHSGGRQTASGMALLFPKLIPQLPARPDDCISPAHKSCVHQPIPGGRGGPAEIPSGHTCSS